MVEALMSASAGATTADADHDPDTPRILRTRKSKVGGVSGRVRGRGVIRGRATRQRRKRYALRVNKVVSATSP